ncbi:alpha/beta fold hydrolase [Euzebya tangerina]|uniref:alpha/beta fold hydrolase n=1 Tax=Euzebya tangerina TaxID=591198 RepID=UPI000E31D663|nr:alpha/beta hydrolase [Euzebya tangerina]
MRTPVRLILGGLGLTAMWQLIHRLSASVRSWEPADRDPVLGGPLAASATPLDADGPLVVLLHGITASGGSFGAAYDDLSVPVVVPDLLGFGGSMFVQRADYTAKEHVQAVIDTLRGLGVAERPLLLVGHSMGAVLALKVAAVLANPVGVVAMSAPLYDSEEEGLAYIGEADPLARLIATGVVAERLCRWMCEHRALARTIWPLLAPKWPRAIAADGVLHTWPAYRGSLQSLVLDSRYADALATLAARAVPVVLVNGDQDGVPVPGRTDALTGLSPVVGSEVVSGADHGLPVSHPHACVAIIERALQRLPDQS